MEFNLAIYSRARLIIHAAVALATLAACAAAPLPPKAEEDNEKAFSRLLKKGEIEKAARFALYFQGEHPTENQSRLMAQYALQTCQPQMAFAYIQKIPAGRETDLFRAATLALISVHRPWSKNLLEGKEPSDLASGHPEFLRQEVWGDEWSRLEFRIQPCRDFPLLPDPASRTESAKEALQIFEQAARVAPFESLTLLGLAMDVGYRPVLGDINKYLSRFSRHKDHPYYLRLKFWADASGKIQKKFQPMRQSGAKVALSELHLTTEEFQPHEVEIPWLAGEESP